MIFDILLYMMAAFVLNSFMGCVVLSSFDDESHSLFDWLVSCPFGFSVGLQIWPYVLYQWFRKRS